MYLGVVVVVVDARSVLHGFALTSKYHGAATEHICYTWVLLSCYSMISQPC